MKKKKKKQKMIDKPRAVKTSERTPGKSDRGKLTEMKRERAGSTRWRGRRIVRAREDCARGKLCGALWLAGSSGLPVSSSRARLSDPFVIVNILRRYRLSGDWWSIRVPIESMAVRPRGPEPIRRQISGESLHDPLRSFLSLWPFCPFERPSVRFF